MAFIDHLSRGHLDAIFVMHVSGIPWLFSHVGCPVRWDVTPSSPQKRTVYGGEVYSWSTTLTIPEEFASVDTKLEPKAGLGQSGGIKFGLRTAGTQTPSTGDLWLDFLTNSLQRTDANRRSASLAGDMTVDLDGAGSQIKLFYNPWTAVSVNNLNLYCGLETFKFTASTSNTATEITGTLERGCYKSQAQRHIGLVRGGESTQAGGKYLADYPLVWAGRIATLYIVPGHLQGGVFYPHATSLDSAENQILFAGFVNDPEEGGDMLGITVPTASLESGIKGQLVSDFPTAKLGVAGRQAGQPTQVYVGPHNAWLHAEVQWGANTVNPRLYIPDHALFAVGDSFSIGANVFTCVVGVPAAFQFNKGANVAVTYQNIVNAVALQLNQPGTQSVIPSNWSLFVELTWVGPGSPALQALAATTASPGALRFTTPNMKAVALQQFKEMPLVRAQNEDGQAPWEPVPEGLHYLHNIARYIRDTLHANLESLYTVNANLSDDFAAPDPEKRVLVLDIKADPVRLWENVTWTWITRWRGRGSILRDLGFTEDSYECQYDPQALGFRAIASKRVALFRWPAPSEPAPRRIYIHGMESDWQPIGWNHAGGWVDDDGDAILPHGYIEGAGVFTFSAFDGSFGFLADVTRAPWFGEREDELYIEATDADDPKAAKVYRVPAFPGCSVNRIILYWLLGGSGIPGTNHPDYDAGWEGAGLSLPAAVVDVDSFLKLAQEVPNRRYNWAVLPGDDVRKLIEEELKLTQQQIVPGLGKLYMISMEPPVEAMPDTVEHLCGPAQTVTDPDQGTGFDRKPERVVNVANVSADYDYAVKKFFLTVKNRAQDSVQTWGEKQPVQIEARGVAVGGAGESLAAALSMAMFAAYGRPYALIEVDIAVMVAWLWKVGDVVKLTHPGLPHPTQASRGVVDLPCRVVAKGDHIFGRDGVYVTVTLLCRAYGGSRWSRWSPSAFLTYNGSATVWRVKDHRFGRVGSDLRDIEYFQTGWRCRCAQWGFFSGVSTPTINAITLDPDPDESTVTFGSSLSGTADRVLWFERHDQAATAATQRAWVYWSAGDGILSLPTEATVRAFSLI